jgi:hypothetical protein
MQNGDQPSLRNLSKNLLLHKINQVQTTNNLITDIGNKKLQNIGNNYYIETEHKKSYPTQVLLV